MQRNETIDTNDLNFDSENEFYAMLAQHYQEAEFNQAANESETMKKDDAYFTQLKSDYETELTKKDKKKPSIKQKLKNKISPKDKPKDKAKPDQHVVSDKVEIIDNTNMDKHAFILYKLISGFDLTNTGGEYLHQVQRVSQHNEIKIFDSLHEFIIASEGNDESESNNEKNVSCDGRILINLNLIDKERDFTFNDADLPKIDTKFIASHLQNNSIFIDLCKDLNLLTSQLTKQEKNKMIDEISAKALLVDIASNKIGYSSVWESFWNTFQLDNDETGVKKDKIKEFVMDALIFVVSQQIGTMMHLLNANQQTVDKKITRSQSTKDVKKSLPSSSSGFFNRKNVVGQKDAAETKNVSNSFK